MSPFCCLRSFASHKALPAKPGDTEYNAAVSLLVRSQKGRDMPGPGLISQTHKTPSCLSPHFPLMAALDSAGFVPTDQKYPNPNEGLKNGKG